MKIINENFEHLVVSLQKYCLIGKKTKSKKYNSYIFDLKGTDMLSQEFKQKMQEYQEQKIKFNEWRHICCEYNKNNYNILERSQHKFKLYVYNEANNFCVDISENKVRTQLLNVPMPQKIIGDHNGNTAVAFEKVIQKQKEKYLSSKQTNIDVVQEISFEEN